MRFFIFTIFLFLSLDAREDITSLINQGEKISAISKYIYTKEIDKPLVIRPRGEFEPKATYDKRASKAKVMYDSVERKEEIKQEALNIALTLFFGKPYLSEFLYNPETKEFTTTLHTSKEDVNLEVKFYVELDEAKAFKQNSEELNINVDFSIYKEELFLKNVDVSYNSKLYSGKVVQPLVMKLNPKYVPNTIDNKLALQKVVDNQNILFASQRESAYDDDLVFLLSRSEAVETDATKWAIIIGIENYQFTDNIIYASRSAKTFEKIVQKRLGVPKENTFTLIDSEATLGNIKNKIRHISKLVQEGDTIFFYYNGHGIPVPSMKNEPFMLASDIEPDFVQDDTFFSLKNIYNRLSKTSATKVIAIVDSCFSGSTDGKSLLKGVAATRLKARSVEFDKDKMAVLTAGKGTQYSNAFREKGHRLFSYFVMKNLIAGESSTYALYKKSYKQTKDESSKMHGTLRVQEPTLNGNAKIEF